MSTMGEASLSVMEVLVLEGSETWRARGPPGGALPLHAVRGARAALDEAALLLDLDEQDLPGVVYRVAEGMQAAGLLEEDDKPALLRTLLLSRRSSLASLQGVGDIARRASLAGVRVGRAEEAGAEEAEAGLVLVGGVGFLARRAGAFVRLARATQLPPLAELAAPVRYLFVLLGPTEQEREVHEAGRAVAALLSNPGFVSLAAGADGKEDLLEAVDEFLDAALVLPPAAPPAATLARRASAPAHHVPPRDEKSVLLALEAAAALPPEEPYDPLTKTGRLFGGVVRDVRRRYPHYVSDLTDAFNGQCLAAAIFMYFAACSSAITFGGLLADKTQGQIGISETLVFTCLGGVVFALTAGQPLMITGATGPLLLLDESLYAFCRSYEFDFLAARFYCGLWMIAIALCVAAVEGSVAVKKITRFTEDIYAFLISLIFISEPLTATIAVYRAHPLGADYCEHEVSLANTTSTSSSLNGSLAGPGTAPLAPQPNTALWCTMLTLATFIIAYYLRIFRNGKFLGRSADRGQARAAAEEGQRLPHGRGARVAGEHDVRRVRRAVAVRGHRALGVARGGAHRHVHQARARGQAARARGEGAARHGPAGLRAGGPVGGGGRLAAAGAHGGAVRRLPLHGRGRARRDTVLGPAAAAAQAGQTPLLAPLRAKGADRQAAPVHADPAGRRVRAVCSQVVAVRAGVPLLPRADGGAADVARPSLHPATAASLGRHPDAFGCRGRARLLRRATRGPSAGIDRPGRGPVGGAAEASHSGLPPILARCSRFVRRIKKCYLFDKRVILRVTIQRDPRGKTGTLSLKLHCPSVYLSICHQAVTHGSC